jgi:hypothetical protein
MKKLTWILLACCSCASVQQMEMTKTLTHNAQINKTDYAKVETNHRRLFHKFATKTATHDKKVKAEVKKDSHTFPFY